jgi:hypothetical protein
MGMNKNTVLGWATFIMIVMGLLLISLGALNIETFLVGVLQPWCWILANAWVLVH